MVIDQNPAGSTSMWPGSEAGRKFSASPRLEHVPVRFSLLLTKQLGPRQITVNALAPGVIDTDMNAYMLGNPEGRAFAASLSVFNRVGTPTDVADIAAFLASPDSRWLAGQYVDATGGTFV